MYKFKSEDVKKDILAFSWSNSKNSFLGALLLFLIITGATIMSVISKQNTKNWIILTITVVGSILILSMFCYGIFINPLKINKHNNISKIETILNEDNIQMTIYYANKEPNTVFHEYKNIIKIKEDRKRFYLFINYQSAISLRKECLENVIEFRDFLYKKIS